MRACAQVNGSLTVDLNGPDTAELPAVSTRVMLVVPVQNSLWRYTTVVEEDALSSGVILLAWPSEVMQEAGRRFERATCLLPVSIAPTGAEGGRTLCSYTLDVSMGGAQIAVPRQFAIGDALTLSIRLSQGTIDVAATVAWCRTIRDEPGDPMYSAGVKFATMPHRAATRLRMLLGANGASAY